MAGQSRGADGLAISWRVTSGVPIVTAGRDWFSPAVTVAGAGLVPGTPCSFGRLAAARSATAPTAAKRTMVTKVFGAISFLMARLLGYQLRSRSLPLFPGPVCPVLTTLCTAAADGISPTYELSPALYSL